MKKIGFGIAMELFAIAFALSSSGMGAAVLLIGAVGLIFALAGFLERG